MHPQILVREQEDGESGWCHTSPQWAPGPVFKQHPPHHPQCLPVIFEDIIFSPRAPLISLLLKDLKYAPDKVGQTPASLAPSNASLHFPQSN